MLRESKMLSIMILGHTPRALLKRYAPTTWRRCKHGMIEEFSSAEDVGPSEAIQRKFWRKNTAMVAADSTDVSHGGLPKRAPGRAPDAPLYHPISVLCTFCHSLNLLDEQQIRLTCTNTTKLYGLSITVK